MPSPLLRIDCLSKRYTLGRAQRRHDTLRDSAAAGLHTAFNRFRRNRHPNEPPDEIFWALREVSFEVCRGEVVGVIGRNGAGKSTLLKILSRITEPTAGTVDIHGRVGSLLEVGTGFHPELTGRENIFLNGAILGMKRASIARQFDAIVAFAEVERFLDTPVKHYSSGMYVRLAFAVAAHLEQDILLVDEVLAVGDAAFQARCLRKMNDLTQHGRTVLFVSHNMGAIRQICTRALLLSAGRVAFDGPVAATIGAYFATLPATASDGVIVRKTPLPADACLCFARVQLQDEAGAALSEIVMDEPIRLAIGFRAAMPLRGVCIGVGLSTPDGIRIATLHHTDGGEAPLSLEPGDYRMTVSLAANLMPGNYAVDIGAHNTLTHEPLDFAPAACKFVVLGASRRNPGFYVPNGVTYNPGLVRLEASWSAAVLNGHSV